MVLKRKARHINTGIRGERAARWYLRLRGYGILERNYRCPSGEIDIVARKKGILVFVEVRTRQPNAPVDPLASIDDLKLARTVDAARSYLNASGRHGAPCRFDIIAVRSGGPSRDRIRHYPDAFRTCYERPVRGMRLKWWIRRQPRP